MPDLKQGAWEEWLQQNLLGGHGDALEGRPAGPGLREEHGGHGQLRQSELHGGRLRPQSTESHSETEGAEQELKND